MVDLMVSIALFNSVRNLIEYGKVFGERKMAVMFLNFGFGGFSGWWLCVSFSSLGDERIITVHMARGKVNMLF